MTVLLHYFSGTGNARRAAQLLSAWFEEQGSRATLHCIEDGTVETHADLHIFLHPVYAMGLPGIMKRYLKQVPVTEGAKAAVISVYGEVNAKHTLPGHAGYSYWQAEQILRTRGYDVVWTDSLGYPESFTSVGNPPTADDIATINAESDARLRAIFDGLVKGERHLCMPRPWVFPVSIPFSGLFQLIGRRVLGQLWVADDRCTGCGLCVKACPAKTIRLHHGRPVWGLSCEGCQRCINICPQQAIQLSLVRLFVALIPWGLFLGLLLSLSGLVSKKERPLLWHLVKITADIAFTLLAWRLLDRLGRHPRHGRWARLNYTHYLRRYTAHPIKK